jgi:hypothetical protein
MPSTFSWLDHSEEQRRKVLDVIDMFKEKGTVDELGLGTIRDALADILFPGTSNLMTRAAYFLFIPWIYQRLERQRVPATEMAAKAKKEELRLVERLLESGERLGVIGRVARGSLQRLPSGVYWSGMKRLRICLFEGSPDAYHRSVDRFYQRRRMAVRTDEGERVGGGTDNWNPRLPSPPDDWPAKAQLALTKTQAEFLRDQIRLAAPTSLFAFLVSQKEAPKDGEFPWMHPFRAQFPEKVIRELDHAQDFSEVMHGAALLYNLMLAEAAENSERQDHYRTWIGEWAESLTPRLAHLREWNRQEAWHCVQSEGARIPQPTREFVDRWCELVIGGGPAGVIDNEQARILVLNRERRLKGGLARLGNKRAIELWQGASGVGQLEFRWTDASALTQDIVSGIHGGADA